jgi:alpha-beta hydrolase superfamily lysophospholipase
VKIMILNSKSVLAAALCLTGCAARLGSKPGLYDTSYELLKLPTRTLDITYVKPVTPRSPVALVIFASGDAGWFGASGDVFKHIAEKGYYAAGFDARTAVKRNRKTGERASVSDTGVALQAVFVHAKKSLGLPETTPVIVAGYSRGATMVVFAAAEKHLRDGVRGGVAVALTREVDYLRAPEAAERDPAIQVDEKGRIQIYPVLARLSSIRFAVIQSANDRYVSAAESRRLMGPDTPALRLYEVKARNHGFDGGRDQLLVDLDDALKWIEESAPR